MYAKYIDMLHVLPAPEVLRDSSLSYSNPLPETLEAFGYLPVRVLPYPEGGADYTAVYEEGDGEIIQNWAAEE